MVAGWLLIISVPTFWYAPNLLTEPSSILIRVGILYAILNRKLIWVVPLGVLAVLVREDNVIVLIAAVLWTLRRRDFRQAILWGTSVAIGSGCLILVRYAFRSLPGYIWLPGTFWLRFNFLHLVNYVNVIACMGVVFPLFVIGIVRHELTRELRSFFLFFTGAMLLPPLYAMISARFDGRPYWTMYPAMLPLAAAALVHLFPSRDSPPSSRAASVTPRH